MTKKFRLALLLAVLTLLGGTITAYAASATRSTSDVMPIGSTDVVGHSTLVRNDNGVTMTFHTSELQPGGAYTAWWVIFETPGGPASTAFWATGNVVGNNGMATFSAHLPKDTITTDQIIFGDGMLHDPRGAEFHLVVRGHGPAIPGMVDDQIHTLNGGCPPNSCANEQFSIHVP